MAARRAKNQMLVCGRRGQTKGLFWAAVELAIRRQLARCRPNYHVQAAAVARANLSSCSLVATAAEDNGPR